MRENGKQIIGLSFRPIREWEVLNEREREKEREREGGQKAEGSQVEIRPIREWEVLNGREKGERQTGGDICVNK